VRVRDPKAVSKPVAVTLAVIAAIAAGVIVWLLGRGGGEPAPGLVTPSDAPAAQPRGDKPALPAAETRSMRPKPFPEVAPDEVESRLGTLEVEVVGTGGKPAAGATLVLRGKDAVLGTGKTNQDGVRTFAAGEGEASLFVFPLGFPRHATTIATSPGRRRVELPAGVSITGRIEVNGAAPREPVSLLAESPGLPDLDAEVWTALRGETPPPVTTSPSGEFAFSGLREGSEWTFFPVTPGYELDEVVVRGERVSVVTAPAVAVLFRLTRLPVIRGRVVTGDPKEPVAGARCRVSLTGPDRAEEHEVESEPSGTFSFAMGMAERSVRITRAQVVVQAPNGVAAKPVVLDPPPDQDKDLGDIAIPAGRAIRYVVRDPAGAPIAGAIARVGEEADAHTSTDAEGKGTIVIGPDTAAIWVGALKHEVRRVPIPAGNPESLDVVLEPATGLEIRVSYGGKPRSDSLRVMVASGGSPVFGAAVAEVDEPPPGVPPLPPPGPIPGTIARRVGATPHVRTSSDGGFLFEPGPDGRVVLTGVRPGVTLGISAVDGLGQAISSTEVTMQPREWKTVELRVTRTPRSLRGRVRDGGGAPVAGARVEVSANPEHAGAKWAFGASVLTTDTREDGRFAIHDLYQDVVHLAVDKSGFSQLVRRDLQVPAGDAEVELTLSKGTTLTVKVVLADGTPIPELELWAETAGLPKKRGEEDPRGTHRFPDLPPDATVTVRTEWAQRPWTRTVVLKGDVTETITMPLPGKVLVDYSAIEGVAFRLHLASSGEEAKGMSWHVAPESAGARVFEADPVLPGTYRVTIAHAMVSSEPASLAAPQDVRVRAGETTRVVLEKP
jgi:hypothetical protein